MKINLNTILKDTDEILRRKSVDVLLPISDGDKKLLMSLFNYVKDSTNTDLAEENNLRASYGVAAVQVGVLKKMLAVIVDVEDRNGVITHHEYALANAKITSNSVSKTYLESGEGCLSVEGVREGYVPRNARIKVKAYDLLQDKEIEIRASGMLSVVLQHEIDHFNGILFYDHINKNNPFLRIPNSICID